MSRPRVPPWLALNLAVLIGVLTAVQARINGQLGVRLGDGLVAAVISFGSGLVILVVLSITLPAGRRGFHSIVGGLRGRSIPLWMLCGGIAGALTVATQGLAIGIIGVSMFTVGIVAGQGITGLVLDRFGIGPAGVVAVTPGRLVGAALSLTAVAVALAGGAARTVPPWMLVLPFLVGVGIAWQQATNGRLRQRVETPLTVTVVNFLGGTIVLVIVATVHSAFAGLPHTFPTELWYYIGGAVGVVYIFLAAAVVAYTGVLLLGLASIVGQVITSMILDLVWPTPASPGLVQQVAIATIALASVVVAAVPWRRVRRAR
ncbi:DMT family transporter [Microbacterium sp. ASV49]|uniref:DMT family transporter n=1 Tax=Microbacterium candidum TaxID=3041922 RepID=A0ABT7MYZ7_9MICO|nr:DMT family transporter [Microbacterium sp. ASV49]MDL9979670.1 DMT family transporter [Microbacterium sp. ASV49]